MEKYTEDLAKIIETFSLSLIELGADPSIIKEGYKLETGQKLNLNSMNQLHPITIVTEYNGNITKCAVIGDFNFHKNIKNKLITDISMNGQYNKKLDFIDMKTNGFIINNSKVVKLEYQLEKLGIPCESITYDEFVELSPEDKELYYKSCVDSENYFESNSIEHYVNLKANCKHKTNRLQKKMITIGFCFENEQTYNKHKRENFKNFRNIFNKALKDKGHKNMMVCGAILPSGTPKNKKNTFKVITKGKKSAKQLDPKLIKNSWNNLEEARTGLVFSDFKIGGEKIVLGKQNKKRPPKFKKGILSLLPLEDRDISICESNGWTTLNEDHIDILSRSRKPSHKKIYRDLKIICPDDNEIVIDEVDENYFDEDDDDYYDYDDFDNDDFDYHSDELTF